MRALNDRIIARRQAAPTISAGGIALPDSYNDESVVRAKVVSAAPDLAVKDGDVIVFARMKAVEVEHDNEKLLVVKEADVLGVLDA